MSNLILKPFYLQINIEALLGLVALLIYRNVEWILRLFNIGNVYICRSESSYLCVKLYIYSCRIMIPIASCVSSFSCGILFNQLSMVHFVEVLTHTRYNVYKLNVTKP